MPVKSIPAALCEEKHREVNRRLDEIMGNHLPHMDAKIDALNVKIDAIKDSVWWLKVGMVVMGAGYGVIKFGEIIKLIP